jgi:hypothetical protein
MAVGKERVGPASLSLLENHPAPVDKEPGIDVSLLFLSLGRLTLFKSLCFT